MLTKYISIFLNDLFCHYWPNIHLYVPPVVVYENTINSYQLFIILYGT